MYTTTDLLIHGVIGFLMAFIGLMSPGLLTLSTLNVAVDRGQKQAVLFALGVIVPIIIQAHIALLGAVYLKAHPEVLQQFSKVAVFVFWTLAIVFYRQYRHRNKRIRSIRFDIRNSFVYGFLVSLINPLAIPFYFTYSTILEMKHVLRLEQPLVSVFVVGAVIGAFTILYFYGKYALLLFSKIQFLAKNFSLILTLSMFLLGIVSLYNSLR